MEFNNKLQTLRKQAGLTQEELASQLYVSRTAISKWESGRGYPNIDSLKAIAKYFHVTVDQLISTDEALTVAQLDHHRKVQRLRDRVSGLLDLSAATLLFLPLFAQRTEQAVRAVALFRLDPMQPWLKISYFFLITVISVTGLMTLALQHRQFPLWTRWKTRISLSASVLSVLLFVLGLHPYAAAFTFTLLLIKLLLPLKQQ